MSRTMKPCKKKKAISYQKLMVPLKNALSGVKPLLSRGNRPLQMTFEDQLDALIFFHLEDHTSGRYLLQALKEDDFVREYIAPKGGIEKSSFFEAINSRGLEQLMQVFEALEKQARDILPGEHNELGEIISVDGSSDSECCKCKRLSPGLELRVRKARSALFVVGCRCRRGFPS